MNGMIITITNNTVIIIYYYYKYVYNIYTHIYFDFEVVEPSFFCVVNFYNFFFFIFSIDTIINFKTNYYLLKS